MEPFKLNTFRSLYVSCDVNSFLLFKKIVPIAVIKNINTVAITGFNENDLNKLRGLYAWLKKLKSTNSKLIIKIKVKYFTLVSCISLSTKENANPNAIVINAKGNTLLKNVDKGVLITYEYSRIVPTLSWTVLITNVES